MPALPLAVVSTAGCLIRLVADKRRADPISYLPHQQQHTYSTVDERTVTIQEYTNTLIINE